MKNLIISILSAIIYYQYCDIKYLWAAVGFGVLIFVTAEEIEDYYRKYANKVRRGERLCRKIRRLL